MHKLFKSSLSVSHRFSNRFEKMQNLLLKQLAEVYIKIFHNFFFLNIEF